MRGIILLCLVGFILSASWPEGGTVPLTIKKAETTRAPYGVWFFTNDDSNFPPEPNKEKQK